MDELQIKQTAIYTWSADVSVVFEEDTQISINAARRGIGYNPMGDNQLFAEYVSPQIDNYKDAFAAKLKKKGFEKSSTGMTANFKEFIFDNDRDYAAYVIGCIVSLEIQRKR